MILMCASSSHSPSSSPSLYSLPSSPSPTRLDLMLDRRIASRDSGLKTRLTSTQRFYFSVGFWVLPSGYCPSSHLPENQGVGKWSWFYWALYPAKVGNGELEFFAKNSHVDSRMGLEY